MTHEYLRHGATPVAEQPRRRVVGFVAKQLG